MVAVFLERDSGFGFRGSGPEIGLGLLPFDFCVLICESAFILPSATMAHKRYLARPLTTRSGCFLSPPVSRGDSRRAQRYGTPFGRYPSLRGGCAGRGPRSLRRWFVRNHQVHVLRDELLNTPGPNLLDGLNALAAIIHPEIFKGICSRKVYSQGRTPPRKM